MPCSRKVRKMTKTPEEKKYCEKWEENDGCIREKVYFSNDPCDGYATKTIRLLGKVPKCPWCGKELPCG